MLLPAVTEAKEELPISKLLALPELASFSVFIFITDVSAPDAEVADGSVEAPDLKIGIRGDEGTVVQKTGLLLEGAEVNKTGLLIEAAEVDAVAAEPRVPGEEARLLVLLLN